MPSQCFGPNNFEWSMFNQWKTFCRIAEATECLVTGSNCIKRLCADTMLHRISGTSPRFIEIWKNPVLPCVDPFPVKLVNNQETVIRPSAMKPNTAHPHPAFRSPRLSPRWILKCPERPQQTTNSPWSGKWSAEWWEPERDFLNTDGIPSAGLVDVVLGCCWMKYSC